MMKVKRIIAILLASATAFLFATFTVGAVSENVTIDRAMNTSYSSTTKNGVGYMYYHVGSRNWGDDVFAYTETRITYGMTGYASVTLKADNNKVVSKYNDTPNSNNGIKTDNAMVSGTDQAQYVRFIGARQDNGQDYVGFNYYIE